METKIEEFKHLIDMKKSKKELDPYFTFFTENFINATKEENFYSIPLNNIKIIANLFYKSINNKENDIIIDHDNCIEATLRLINELKQRNSDDYIGLINLINIPNITLKECVSLISAFQTSYLCKALKSLYDEDMLQAEVDWPYQLDQKDQMISSLRSTIERMKLPDKPDVFEPNILVASAKGDLDSVKYSIEALHTPIDYSDPEFHRTPLYRAAGFGRLEVVKYLVTKGANTECATIEDVTPLYIASQQGYIEVVKFLVENGANIEAPQKDSARPLYIACHNGHFDIVEYLINQGADIEATENEGATPLHAAAEEGNLQIVQLLCKHGAKISPRDIYGYSPLDIAFRNGYHNICDFLVSMGAG